jgi:hypothetical protein
MTTHENEAVTRLNIEHPEHRIGQAEYNVVPLPDSGELSQEEELLEQAIEKSPGQLDLADQGSSGNARRACLGNQLNYPVGLGHGAAFMVL